jgi:sugar phosphate permease
MKPSHRILSLQGRIEEREMENQSIHKVLRYRWLIFWLLALAYLFVYFHRTALSVVEVDLENAFQTSASLMGFLGSVYFYCYAFMQFPAGLISDSLGPRKGVTFFLVIASVGSIMFGMAPNIGMAILGRFLVGLGVSLVFIATMKILSQWFRAGEFAFMAAVLNAMGGLGIIISTAPLAMMAGSLGWRLSFELIGILTLGIALLVWFIVKDRPADMGWPSIAEIEKRKDAATGKTRSISLLEGAKRVVTEKYFWPVGIWFFFDCGVFFGFGALWSGPYLMHVYGMSQKEAGVILIMIGVGMIVGSPLISLLSDRFLRSRRKLLMLSSTGLILDLLILNLFPVGLSTPVLLLVFLFFSLCSSAIVFVAFTTTKELFPIEIAGTSVGTLNLFPFLGGAVFMPLLGRVLDAYPKSGAAGYPLKAYSAMLLVLLAASVIALVCTFFMKETSPYGQGPSS